MLKKNKSKIVKGAIIILVIIILAGIWVLKNSQDESAQPMVGDNSDFSLFVTEKLDLEKLKSYGVPIIIDFGADSCIPCKEMAPVLKELNEELQGKVIIRFVDVWKYPDFADGYPISVIPTQIFIGADGKPFSPKDPDTMQMKLYSTKDTGEHVFTTHEGGMTKEDMLKVIDEMGVN